MTVAVPHRVEALFAESRVLLPPQDIAADQVASFTDYSTLVVIGCAN